MLIRPLKLQDKSKIYQTVCQGDTFNEGEIQVAMELVDEVLNNPANQDYLIYSAVYPAEVFAGYICFGPIPMTAYCYDLYWIAVDQRFSKKGVGSRLVEFMEADIRRNNGKYIYVDTSSTIAYAPARSFYEKHGYRPVCTLNDFFKDGDHKVIFRKEL
jgi:ribosomal protein S18 acetylase RimI-like enzyme